ncbi:DNA-directed RNA polymerase subunit beta', partial [Candidatus Falkowbacteria bacterium]|nr:DNA-directed RNA polymerase subunit beta' [Candidatus Falkowbacteria bacterium]
LKPATGNPVTAPSMDMVWGSFYVTSIKKSDDPVKIFSSVREAKLAYDLRKISLRQKIKVRVLKDELGAKVKENILETCMGRILFNDLYPSKIPFYNEVVDKKKMAGIVQLCLEYYGFEKTAEVLDRIKNFGFKQLTKAGFSWGIGDLPDVEGKQEQVKKGIAEVDQVEQQYEEGFLTADERYSKIIEIWTRIKDSVTALTKDILDEEGPVYSMINSGARGSWGQLSQMLGMKGLVTNPSGQIIELPVKANFKEGFSVLEYYISTHGTRKGLSDTALRTANAGYLTRRLVDVAQDVIIKEEDCGDTKGKVITQKECKILGQNLIEKIVGRFVLEPIKHPKTGKEIVKAGEIVTEEKARSMEGLEIEQVTIRSLLSCKLPKGVCQKCYGFDLAHNKLVKKGTSVGIIAAQSIGEPGTQLTMRTFHTGGVAGTSDITQGLPRVEEIFEARIPKKKALIAEVGGLVSIQEKERVITGPKGEIVAKSSFGEKLLKVTYNDTDEETFKLKADFAVKVKDGEFVKDKDVLYLDENKKKVKTKRAGRIELGEKELKIVDNVEKEKEYVIAPGTVLWVKDGDMVEKGTQLTEGHLDLQQYFKIAGKRKVQDYIQKEIQYIYSSQGQKLNDKHVELIARQMFSRIYVKDSGDTSLLEGEVVERSAYEIENSELKKSEKQAIGEEVFLGISKVSLTTDSFLSAASFQETARVLINAAVNGKEDKLEGLKENVIIGRLIPAGTGLESVAKEILPEIAKIKEQAAKFEAEAAENKDIYGKVETPAEETPAPKEEATKEEPKEDTK